jgi:hypothetical protein
MLRKFLCVALLAAFAIPAQAGVLSSLVTTDGLVDTLDDAARGFYVDTNSSSTIDSGDVIFGWLQVNSVNGANTGINPPSLVGIYSITLGAVGAANDPTASFSAGASTGTYSLANLAPSLVGASSATSAQKDASLFVLGGSQSFYDAGSVTSASAGETGAIDILSQIDSAVGFEALMGFGDSDDFMDVFVVTASIIAEAGGFTVFDSTLGTGSDSFIPLTGANGGTHDVLQTVGTVTPNTGPGPWTYQGTNQFAVNAVPEPGSFAIFGALLIGGVARRRRQK